MQPLVKNSLSGILAPWLAVVLLGWPAGAGAVVPDLPRLDWQPRSDWLNVKQQAVLAAKGDGVADDTAALQAVLDRGATGQTIYFPPGTYRLTQTLVFHGPGLGSAIIGSGRDTRLVWDGPIGGRMFWSDGVAYSRYVGLVWDGQGKAAVGFDHAAQHRFETEITHEFETFRNFTGFGIRVGNEQKVASAEILYRNCRFENCGTALGLLTFNDYDNTLDGCEFDDCGTGVYALKSNFYARNCHFENSRDADFSLNAEHGCSIRRCTSVGAKSFVQERNPITPLTIQDCQVARWTDPAGAVVLASPTLMFDCVFSQPPPGGPPVKLAGNSQKLIVSHNLPAPLASLVRPAAPKQIVTVPPGQFSGVVASPDEHFLRTNIDVSGRVFDAVRDFGAKGNGKADDTAALQSAIDAAQKFGHGATAYLPTGAYSVSRTLLLSGQDYQVSGSGLRCGLVWHGKAGEPIVHLSGVTNVTLANLAVGQHDFGQMNHGDDVLVTSPAGMPCRLILDGVYGFGMYDKSPDKHGLHFLGLPVGSVVDALHVQGNLRLTDCARATVLFRTSYEGSLTVEGQDPVRDGQLGFLTRLATVSRPALRVFDNQSLVMSDFYVEQCDQVAVFAGAAGQPDGAVTIQSPKLQISTTNAVFEIQDYAGRIYYGQTMFYCQPVETRFRSSGTRPVQVLLAGDFWYNNHPAFELSPSVNLTLLGNTGAADTSLAPAAATALSAALDDLRRLGQLDHRLTTDY